MDEYYTDPELEHARKRGFADGEAGEKCMWHDILWVNAYLLGYDQGDAKRKSIIRAKKTANLIKARAAKTGK
jgi:hypothetical protein